MSNAVPVCTLATTLLTLISVTASKTQTHVDHAAHGHHNTQSTIMSAMPPAAPAPASHASHGALANGGAASQSMDHGEMQIQGGSAPPNARNPHGYSDGQQNSSGDFVVPGVARLMLGDEHPFASLRGETLEQRFTRRGDDSTAYDLQAWFGTTYNKAILKADGDIAKAKREESRTELLWGHAIAPYWDTQLGVRVDNGEGPSRQWLVFGIQGLAPYWLELEATGYVGNDGRIALRLKGSYALLLTQRLILEPRAELQYYSKDDWERRIAEGVAEASAGLRMRYEISRQFAPYIGVERANRFGHKADDVRAEGGRVQQTRWVVGVRFWF